MSAVVFLQISRILEPPGPMMNPEASNVTCRMTDLAFGGGEWCGWGGWGRVCCLGAHGVGHTL